jgi:hypothetical protein
LLGKGWWCFHWWNQVLNYARAHTQRLSLFLCFFPSRFCFENSFSRLVLVIQLDTTSCWLCGFCVPLILHFCFAAVWILGTFDSLVLFCCCVDSGYLWFSCICLLCGFLWFYSLFVQCGSVYPFWKFLWWEFQ